MPVVLRNAIKTVVVVLSHIEDPETALLTRNGIRHLSVDRCEVYPRFPQIPVMTVHFTYKLEKHGHLNHLKATR